MREMYFGVFWGVKALLFAVFLQRHWRKKRFLVLVLYFFKSKIILTLKKKRMVNAYKIEKFSQCNIFLNVSSNVTD